VEKTVAIGPAQKANGGMSKFVSQNKTLPIDKHLVFRQHVRAPRTPTSINKGDLWKLEKVQSVSP
jgi:hypothetical protein